MRKQLYFQKRFWINCMIIFMLLPILGSTNHSNLLEISPNTIPKSKGFALSSIYQLEKIIKSQLNDNSISTNLKPEYKVDEIQLLNIVSTPLDLTGSTVTLKGGNPLTAGTSGTLTFQVANNSPDDEYIASLTITFPVGWTVACNSQDAQDSGGNSVGLTCSPSSNLVNFNDSGGDIRTNNTWNFSLDVTAPISTPRGVYDFDYNLVGDNFGSAPHSVSATVAGAITVVASSGGAATGNLSCSTNATEITGTVFEDYNFDGDYDSGENLGVTSVTVTATDSLGNSFTDNTDANGDFEITGLTAGRTYRVGFTNIPSSIYPTFYGGDNGTTVQFVQPGNCANLGVSDENGPCPFNGGTGNTGESGLWIYIGDTLNPADGAAYSTTVSGSPVIHNDPNQVGRGAIDYEYWVMNSPIRLIDYLEFLNDVDPANSAERWEAGLVTNAIVPSVTLVQYDAGEALGARWKPVAYSQCGQSISVADMENMAVSFISFPLAARFANWAATGDVNQGAYTFASPTSATASITAIDNSWTGFRLPTEDEFYKALYWDQDNLTYNL